MVDVDDAAGHCLTELRRQDLHISCEDNKLNSVFANQIKYLAFLFLFRVLVDWQMIKWYAIALGQGLIIWVVGDYSWNVDAQLAGLCTEQKIVEAMTNLRYHDEHPRLLRDGTDIVVHLNICREGVERLSDFSHAVCRPEVNSHEELFRDWITELLKLQNVDCTTSKYASHGVHDPRLVRA